MCAGAHISIFRCGHPHPSTLRVNCPQAPQLLPPRGAALVRTAIPAEAEMAYGTVTLIDVVTTTAVLVSVAVIV